MPRKSDERGSRMTVPGGGDHAPGGGQGTRTGGDRTPAGGQGTRAGGGDRAPAGVTGRTLPDEPRRDTPRGLRILALTAVTTGLLLIAAAAFVLSYSGVYALARQAGVSSSLARIYPLIFDAMLVVAGCSVLALRGAGLLSRAYAWICLVTLLGGLAAGSAANAAAILIPHRPAALAAAIIPWVLVLFGFGLLLALLRQARLRRLGQGAAASWRPAALPPEGTLPTGGAAQADGTAQAAGTAQAGGTAQAADTTQAAGATRDVAPAPIVTGAPSATMTPDTAPTSYRVPAPSPTATPGTAGTPAAATPEAATTPETPAVPAPSSAGSTGPATIPAQWQLRARVPRPPEDPANLGTGATAGPGDPPGDHEPGDHEPGDHEPGDHEPGDHEPGDPPDDQESDDTTSIADAPAGQEHPVGSGEAGADSGQLSAAPTPDQVPADEPPAPRQASGNDAEPPVFDRPRSSPTPPAD